MDDWRSNLLDDNNSIQDFLQTVRTVAVIGIKPEWQSDRPAHYVPATLQRAGLTIIPVPVYFPEIESILGQPVHRSLSTVSDPIDIVNLFRRPVDIAGHVDEILQARPRMVWMQSGIRNAEAAEQFARAGIKVVQDRCLMVEYRG